MNKAAFEAGHIARRTKVRVKKTVLAQLDKCYAVLITEVDGDVKYIVATEGVGPCLAFSASGRPAETVWEGPGGTMNIVPIPGKHGEFLATQDFVPTFQAKESKVVHVRKEEGVWKVRPLITVPYLHRFDLCRVGKRLVFVGATLALYKEDKEDWSKPGSVYVGVVPEDISGPFPIRPVLGGITKNHGFCRGSWKDRPAYLVSGVEGVWALYVPGNPELAGFEGAWESERILGHEVSDIAVCDLDGDGKLELAAIEPFHGSSGKIYKEREGALAPILEHGYEFGHVVWGGTIGGRPAMVIGGRKGNRELNLFTHNASTGAVERLLIDDTGGASNIAVRNEAGRDLILAANREIGEVALYELTN